MAVERLWADDPPTIGSYELLGRLGAGAMGQVFLGRTPDGRFVAIKTVHEQLARQARFRQRFRSEVRAAQRAGGTWVAAVLDSDTESPVPWVATAYVTGAPLQAVVDGPHGPLPERSVWALAHGLGQALTRIHDVGLVHRDLKPGNVMVAPEGPKVIDFGIARALDSDTRLTRTGAVIGTPGYMAPEQIGGELPTGAADVFSLGAVLAFAVTGLPPFSWGDAGVPTVLYRVMHQPPEIGPQDGLLRGALRDLVVRCLAKDPGERPDLAELLPLAQAEAEARTGAASDRGGWLPPLLAAQLEEEAKLLPPVPPDQDTYVPPPTDAPVPAEPSPPGATPAPDPGVRPRRFPRMPWTAWPTWSGRRRRRYVLGTVSAVTVLTLAGWLVVRYQPGDPPPDDAGSASGSAHTPLTQVVPPAVRKAGEVTVHIADRDRPTLDTEGRDPSGFEVDLIEEMAQRLGVRVHFTEHGHDEQAVPAAVKAGRTSRTHIAMADLPDTAENRAEWGVDMVDHSLSGLGVVGTKEYHSLSEVCGGTVTTYPDLQEQVRDEADCARPLTLLPFDKRDNMVAAVMSGKADAIVLQYPLAVEQIGFEQPDTQLTVSLVRDARGPRGIAVPTGQPQLRKALVAALRATVADGTYERLLKRWHLLDAAIGKVEVNAGH